MTKSANEIEKSVGTDFANRVQAIIQERVIELEDLASARNVREGNDKQKIFEEIAEDQKRIGKLDNTIFIFPDGLAIRSDGSTGQLGDREYFKKVVETHKPVISDMLVSRSTGKASVNIAVPIIYNGQLRGVLTGTFALDKLSSMIKELNFKDTGYGTIVEASGLLFAHPTMPELVGKLNYTQKKVNPKIKMQMSELDDRIIALFSKVAETGKQEQGTYTFLDGINQIGVYTPINLPGADAG